MWEILLFAVIFTVSLTVLIKAADYFTIAAEKIGLFVGLPAFFVGVTIVSIGTSLPELVSSVLAIFQGSSEIILGNVVGSNVANVFLILGITVLVHGKRLDVNCNLAGVDLPLFVGSATLLTLVVFDGKFSIGEAIVLFLAYVVYILYVLSDSQANSNTKEADFSFLRTRRFLIIHLVVLVTSSGFIFLGAEYTIFAVQKIAALLNIGQEVIALSVVAIGTSLPELIVSLAATRKGNTEMAIGNVLGSNIFNALVVAPVPRFFGEVPIPDRILSIGFPTLIAATILLFFAVQDRCLTRWEGWLFLIFYVWFIGQTLELL